MNNVVLGNFIGTDVNGTAAVANGNGVVIQSGASSNLIGGSDPTVRNVISGNGTFGVLITGAGTTQNIVAANYIGTDKTGNLAVGNRSRGVQIAAGANHNFVGTNGDGSADATEGNVISGNTIVGVFITGRVRPTTRWPATLSALTRLAPRPWAMAAPAV